MNLKDLKWLVREQWSADLEPGYNYTIFSVRHRQGATFVASALRRQKTDVERLYRARSGAGDGWRLLPMVCLQRRRSVLIPVPYETELNVLAGVIREVLARDRYDVKIPAWG